MYYKKKRMVPISQEEKYRIIPLLSILLTVGHIFVIPKSIFIKQAIKYWKWKIKYWANSNWFKRKNEYLYLRNRGIGFSHCHYLKNKTLVALYSRRLFYKASSRILEEIQLNHEQLGQLVGKKTLVKRFRFKWLNNHLSNTSELQKYNDCVIQILVESVLCLWIRYYFLHQLK